MTGAAADPYDLSGKRALITGGSRGIGAAIAMRLAAAGARVIINYRSNDASARETNEAIARAGGVAELAAANLVEPAEIRSLFERVRLGGALDILVHCAALGSFKPTLDVRANQWDLTMNVNARALLLCAQHAAEMMPSGGKIVALSSMGGSRVIPNYGAIGVSKAAVEALVRYLGVALAPRGVQVNAIAAGLIDTASIRQHPQHATMERMAREQTPAGRIGQPDDIANIALFLCSPLADWIVGQTIVADGGNSLLG